MEDQQDLAVYVLVRTDLPSMNAGKAMSQVHHSGVQMMAQYSKLMRVQDYVADGVAQGAAYFNTTIVLGATLSDIFERSHAALEAGEHVALCNIVTDPSYPFLVENMEIAHLIPQNDITKIIKVLDTGKVLMVREEVTCAWFLGSRTDPEFRALFNGLDLHA